MLYRTTKENIGRANKCLSQPRDSSPEILGRVDGLGDERSYLRSCHLVHSCSESACLSDGTRFPSSLGPETWGITLQTRKQCPERDVEQVICRVTRFIRAGTRGLPSSSFPGICCVLAGSPLNARARSRAAGLLLFLINLFILLINFGCVGSSLLCTGFL